MSVTRFVRQVLRVLMAVLAAFGRPYQPDPPEKTAIVLHAEQTADDA